MEKNKDGATRKGKESVCGPRLISCSRLADLGPAINIVYVVGLVDSPHNREHNRGTGAGPSLVYSLASLHSASPSQYRAMLTFSYQMAVGAVSIFS